MARDVAEAVGLSLLHLRGKASVVLGIGGDRYKTSADKAAEGWIVAYLSCVFPGEPILSEEAFDEGRSTWKPTNAYWIVDGLDGTASFVDGFDGFCVQVGYVVDAVPVLGVIHEPASATTYWAAAGQGAYKRIALRKARQLVLKPYRGWPTRPVFVDTTRSEGAVGTVFRRRHGRFLECGGSGTKLCRVASGKAHVFAKRATYKTWDIAPGQAIVRESGGDVRRWDGSEIRYDRLDVQVPDVLAAPRNLIEIAAAELKRAVRT